MEDAAVLELPDDMDMIQIYEQRIEALMNNVAPRRSDVPVKLRAVAKQINQIARLCERRYRV
jgi:hypothetical protein